MPSEDKFQLSICSEAKGFKLKLRLKGVFNSGSPNKKSQYLVGSMTARAKNVLLCLNLTLLQVLGKTSDKSNQNKEVQYSVRMRLRNFCLRIKGWSSRGENRDLGHSLGTSSSASQSPSMASRFFPRIKGSWEKNSEDRDALSLGTSGNKHAKQLSSIFTKILPKGTRNREQESPQGRTIGRSRTVRTFLHSVGKDQGAVMAKALVMIATLVMLMQLAGVGAMPVLVLAGAGTVVTGCLLLLNCDVFNPHIRQLWQEVISVGGFSILPQIVLLTFAPYLPYSNIPGTVIGGVALIMVLLARFQKLLQKILKVMRLVSRWIPVVLFILAPVAQMGRMIQQKSYWSPADSKRLSQYCWPW